MKFLSMLVLGLAVNQSVNADPFPEVECQRIHSQDRLFVIEGLELQPQGLLCAATTLYPFVVHLPYQGAAWPPPFPGYSRGFASRTIKFQLPEDGSIECEEGSMITAKYSEWSAMISADGRRGKCIRNHEVTGYVVSVGD